MQRLHRNRATTAGPLAASNGRGVYALPLCVALLSPVLPGDSFAGTALLTYHLQRSDIECLVENRERITASTDDPIILGLDECPPAENEVSLPVVDSFPKFPVQGDKFNRLIIIPKRVADCYFAKLKAALATSEVVVTVDFLECG